MFAKGLKKVVKFCKEFRESEVKGLGIPYWGVMAAASASGVSMEL